MICGRRRRRASLSLENVGRLEAVKCGACSSDTCAVRIRYLPPYLTNDPKARKGCVHLDGMMKPNMRVRLGQSNVPTCLTWACRYHCMTLMVSVLLLYE